MKIVTSNHHFKHAPDIELIPGNVGAIFEKPERAKIVHDNLLAAKIGPMIEPAPFEEQSVLAVHTAAYYQFLCGAHDEWRKLQIDNNPLPCVWPLHRMRPNKPDSFIARLGSFFFDGTAPITGGTAEAAKVASSIATTATDAVTAGDNAAFALCRPPGHHAGADYGGGYCFLNNAAIAAQRLLDSGASKVALLDVDYHHGNGTQDIFYSRPDVFFASVHGDPVDEFPYYTGYADETGSHKGEGFNLNIPLAKGSNFEQWQSAVLHCTKRITDYKADALVVSLGLDTFKDDPISFFTLETGNYLKVGQLLASLKLPTVLVFEGGYAVDDLGKNTANVLLGFENN